MRSGTGINRALERERMYCLEYLACEGILLIRGAVSSADEDVYGTARVLGG